MTSKVFNIPADVAFLPALARAILAGGFPTAETLAPSPDDLPRWTVLLPTRRAARVLQQAFLDSGPVKARLLPRIRPIGDIDEDALDGGNGDDLALPPALDPVAREFLLIRLIGEWAKRNPQELLAQELSHSPGQALSLAVSLGELVDGFETEEIGMDGFAELFAGDFARHRTAILGFLDIIRTELPRALEGLGVMGQARRRSLSIEREALRLAADPPAFPIIAAGSTGTVPATARLLKTIAETSQGAVVLPGLDTGMDDESWAALEPQHAQYGLKSLLSTLAVDRREVSPLPGIGADSPRAWVTSEVMRPTETTGRWQAVIAGRGPSIAAGLDGVQLIEASDRREEAAAVALIMRDALRQPRRTAALITPDRDLARRVKAELGRWGIEVDDSAGEPLIRQPAGSLMALLIEAAMAQFSALSLAALVHHPMAGCGAAARLFEAAVLRQVRLKPGLGGLEAAMAEARAATSGEHAHPHIRRLGDAGWRDIAGLAASLAQKLRPLEAIAEAKEPASLAQLVEALIASGEGLAQGGLWTGDGGEALSALLSGLHRNGHHLPEQRFAAAAQLVLHHLRAAPVRAAMPAHPRLQIYGLLEARLVRADVTILGALNEGIWPGRGDPGPWLNRPMRQTLNLQPPERHIGLTAHDFTQAFGAPVVHLTWSRRLGDAPGVASRWVLRLRMLMAGAGIAVEEGPWRATVRGLDAPGDVKPVAKPAPRPPVSARPMRLSVTRIEQLIRDPYAIFARSILGLEPLPDLAQGPDAMLRGSLVHAALHEFCKANSGTLPQDAPDRLVAAGRAVFAAVMDDPDVANFWWPRFLRIARWFCEEERELRRNLRSVATELSGATDIALPGQIFKLTGRADRIDLLSDGRARIVDYKTGSPPSGRMVESGLSPQLTLEAAILARGGFEDLPAASTAELLYIRLSGGEPAGEMKPVKGDAMALAERHMAGLVSLLTAYLNPDQPYLPRRLAQYEDDPLDYDHLSRFKEWSLAGGRP